jgi:hypothetical protein
LASRAASLINDGPTVRDRIVHEIEQVVEPARPLLARECAAWPDADRHIGTKAGSGIRR